MNYFFIFFIIIFYCFKVYSEDIKIIDLHTAPQNENETGQDNNESGKKLTLTKETDTKLKRIKNTLKEKHYLTHCQICCLSDIASSNESENLLVKKLGKINRKKLMDVHHIHSKERGGDVYNMGSGPIN